MKKHLNYLLLPLLLLTACDSNKEKTYTVKWLNYNDQVIEEDKNVKLGEMPSFDSENPTRPNSEDYSYVFIGWDKDINPVTSDVEYKAVYDSIQNKFTVLWKNFDGTILQKDEHVARGTIPQYNGVTPTRTSTAEYSFEFKGWDRQLTPINADTVFNAVYNNVKNTYTITWLNDDGSTIEVETYEYGSLPAHEDASKSSDSQYDYVFDSWVPSISEVTGNATYKASYTTESRKYKIRFVNASGIDVCEMIKVEYNGSFDVPTFASTIFTEFEGFKKVTGFDKDKKPITTGDVLTDIPHTEIKEDYTYLVLQNQKQENKILLNKFNNETDLTYSAWGDYGVIEDSDEVGLPTGSALSNSTKSKKVTINQINGFYVGHEFFTLINEFNDTDYIGIWAYFDCPTGNWKYDTQMYISEGKAHLGTGGVNDNKGTTLYEGGTWGGTPLRCTLQTGNWQLFKVYVHEIKHLLNQADPNNDSTWDTINISYRNLAIPCAYFYDVEFVRADFTKDFEVTEINSSADIVKTRGTAKVWNETVKNTVSSIQDITLRQNTAGDNIALPSNSIKKGKRAASLTPLDWQLMCGFDISLVSNNIDYLNDNDEIVVFIYVTGCLYGNDNGFNRGNANYQGCLVNWKEFTSGYWKQVCVGGCDEGWTEFRIKISEFKALTPLSSSSNSQDYLGDFLTEILCVTLQPNKNDPIYMYSVEVQKAK